MERLSPHHEQVYIEASRYLRTPGSQAGACRPRKKWCKACVKTHHRVWISQAIDCGGVAQTLLIKTLEVAGGRLSHHAGTPELHEGQAREEFRKLGRRLATVMSRKSLNCHLATDDHAKADICSSTSSSDRRSRYHRTSRTTTGAPPHSTWNAMPLSAMRAVQIGRCGREWAITGVACMWRTGGLPVRSMRQECSSSAWAALINFIHIQTA